MAKSFLNYGTAKGLGKSIDYTSIINQRLKNEGLLNQSKQRAEERAAYIAEKMTPFNSEIKWITDELNPFYDNLNKQMVDFFKNNPNWRYSTEGQMKFNELSQKYLNNPLVNIHETSKRNYEAFQKSMPKLTRKQIVREQEKYRQYFEGEQEKKGPYVFDASEPYNLTDIFTTGASALEIDFGSKGYIDWEKVSPEKLGNVALTTYMNNKEDLDDAWNSISPDIKSNRFGNNKMSWIKENIRAQKSEGESLDRSAQVGMARVNTSASGNQVYDYYSENILGPELPSDRPLNVNKNWLLTANADVTDPEKGGALNDPNEIYYKDENGSLVSLKDFFNFSNVKLTNAHNAFSVSEEEAKAAGGYNEFMTVSADIEWDGGASLGDLNREQKAEVIKRALAINLRRNDKELDEMQALIAASMPDFSSAQGSSNFSHEYEKSLYDTRKFKGTLVIPIQRNKKEAKTVYNKLMSTATNAKEVDITGPSSGSNINVTWVNQ